MILKQFIRFVLIGALGFAVDSGLLFCGLALGADAFTARLFSIAIALLCTWLLNRRFTFPSSTAPTLAELLRYLAVNGTGAGINYVIYSFCILFLGTPIPVAFCIGSALALLFNFFGNGRFVFGKKHKEPRA